MLYFSLLGTFVTLCIALPVWETPDLGTWVFLILTGVSGGLGQVAMTRAYSLDSAARISALSYLGIIFTNLLAIPIFGDIPGFLQVVGTGFVILSGIFITFSSNKKWEDILVDEFGQTTGGL